MATAPELDKKAYYQLDRDTRVDAYVSHIYEDGRVDLTFEGGEFTKFGISHGTGRQRVRQGFGSREPGTFDFPKDLPDFVPPDKQQADIVLLNTGQQPPPVVPATVDRDKSGRPNFTTIAETGETKPAPIAEGEQNADERRTGDAASTGGAASTGTGGGTSTEPKQAP